MPDDYWAGFNDDEFEIALQLAFEGKTVVSRSEDTPAPGADGYRRFDAWVDGVRAEFKNPTTTVRKTFQKDVLSKANKQGADLAIVHLENMGRTDAMNWTAEWIADPRRTVNLSRIVISGVGYSKTFNVR